MSEVILYKDDDHINYLLEDATGVGLAVQANHHLIVHKGEGMILDPGGHKVFARIQGDVSRYTRGEGLRYVFLSHQDPDVLAATNGWLMISDAEAYISALWTRFVPHFGVDQIVEHRLKPIPDEGTILNLNGVELLILPAHFMHSTGNFQVYDPVSKILYTGDLGASLGTTYRVVPDFDEHIQYMEGFHRRYITCNAVLQAWANMIKGLDIEAIAPQHGAIFQGREMVNRFIDWVTHLKCGLDLMLKSYKIPRR